LTQRSAEAQIESISTPLPVSPEFLLEKWKNGAKILPLMTEQMKFLGVFDARVPEGVDLSHDQAKKAWLIPAVATVASFIAGATCLVLALGFPAILPVVLLAPMIGVGVTLSVICTCTFITAIHKWRTSPLHREQVKRKKGRAKYLKMYGAKLEAAKSAKNAYFAIDSTPENKGAKYAAWKTFEDIVRAIPAPLKYEDENPPWEMLTTTDDSDLGVLVRWLGGERVRGIVDRKGGLLKKWSVFDCPAGCHYYTKQRNYCPTDFTPESLEQILSFGSYLNMDLPHDREIMFLKKEIRDIDIPIPSHLQFLYYNQ
jgi:hypothetical protein